jgi:hypothetical protein
MVFYYLLHQSQSVKQWFMVAKVRYEWHAFGVHISKEYMIDAVPPNVVGNADG